MRSARASWYAFSRTPSFSGNDRVKIKLLFFASLREQLGTSGEEVDLPPRWIRCSRSAATVVTPEGRSTSSPEVPSCSRRDAKKRSLIFTRSLPEKLGVREKAYQLALADRMRGRVVDQPIGPCGRSEHGRVLRRVQLQAALRVPFRAQELAPRVGLGPVEIGARRDGLRLHLLQALGAQQERAHEDEEGDEARDRVARQTDECRLPYPSKGERATGLHRDAPHEQAPLGFDRGLHVVGIADRDAARGDDEVALPCGAAQDPASRIEAVGDDAVVAHLAIERLREAPQREAVRVVDAPGRERLTRHDELVAGEEKP